MEKDYYKILGVDKNSTEDEIKMAYKKLAMRYHPDRNPNNSEAEEKFKEIKLAYEILTNKDKRVLNDSYEGNTSSNMDFSFSDFIDTESSLDDVFKIIFNKNYKKNLNKVIATIDINLEQAVYGSIFYSKINYTGNCRKCLGKGYKSGSNVKICSKCSGTGLFTSVQGLFTFRQRCYKCNGRGCNSSAFCSNCNGLGKINKNILCKVVIEDRSDNNSIFPLYPVEDDDDLIFDNSFVLIKIKPHPLFLIRDLKNNDLHCKFVIDFIKAILGGDIKVYTLHGYINYEIRKGTQNNEIYKIKYFGLNLNKFKNIGDLYLEIIIEIPFDINQYQEFLLKKIKLSIHDDISYPLKSKFFNILENFYNSILN